MTIKEFLIDFIGKNHLDLFFYILVSLVIFLIYWEFVLFKIIGIFVSLLGFILWILGLIHLKESFNILPEAKKLITSGIYSKIRNPIYIGGGLVTFGYVIYTINVPVLNFILIGLFVIEIIIQFFRIRAEEKVLTERFGDKYIKYKKRTWF